MWTRGLRSWYTLSGRHHLPWRNTRDPWPILVSEVMLQQTQVNRVLGRWQAFLERWPTASGCAQADLADVLRAWHGLGYPRRARALHECSKVVAATGWPRTESELRALPGIGVYTARALLTFTSGEPSGPPLDVNIARVSARAAFGVEPEGAGRASLEAAVTEGRPRGMDRRDYVYALFDAGAIHCRSVPICTGCPLRRACRYRAQPAAAAQAIRRPVQRYRGSNRELRGAILAAMLGDGPPRTVTALERRVASLSAAATSGATAGALQSLIADGLLPPGAIRDPGAAAPPR